MIEFRQKNFIAPVVLGMIASTGIGVGQSAIQSKKDKEQATEFQERNEKLQQRQTAALNRIAVQAEKNPQKAQEAAGIVAQKSYAAIPAGLGSKLAAGSKKWGQVAYEFARGINKSGSGNQIVKKVGTGLAMGTTMAAGGYLVDKAIQADRKRLTGGAPLPQGDPNAQQKNKGKGLKKVALTGAALGATVLAARKGYLGQGFKNLSHGLNSAGQKINKTSALKGLGNEYKKGFKEQFITKDPVSGKNKLNKFGTALTLGFAGMGAVPYLGERSQLKAQANAQGQQKQYAEPAQEAQQGPKRGSFLKKAAIGAGTAAAAFALARRGAMGTKLAKSSNELFMTYGNKLAGKSGTGKLGNWMMKSGASNYAKAAAKTAQKNIGKVANSAGKNADKAKAVLSNFNSEAYAQKAGAARLKAVQSGAASRKLGQGVLGGISGFMGGGGQKNTNAFLTRMARDGSNSQATKDAANFLMKHKRTALVGATGLGLLSFKPFGWGDSAVRKAAGAVDKNAFAYEKSKEQQV